MRVRIKQATPDCKYYDFVGDIFHVTKYVPDKNGRYWVNYMRHSFPDYGFAFIDSINCEILKDIEISLDRKMFKIA
jgi:hypothetical protein